MNSNSVLLEDYIDLYLKKKHADKAWVGFAFSLEAEENEYKDGLKKCREVQGIVIRALNRSKDIKAVDNYIDEAVKLVG